MKVCMVGENAVGKTSLVKRFVFDQFSDNYLGTIGTKVKKKVINIRDPDTKEPLEVHLMVWDIMGHVGFRQLLKESYFFGANGIVGVCDNTREKTLPQLEGWVNEVQEVAKSIPLVFLGNKCDLIDEQQISLNEIESSASGYEKSIAFLSSAKTGFNVDLAFKILGEKILVDML